MIEFHLCCILLILVSILILKLYLQKSYNNTNQLKQLHSCSNKNCRCKSNEDIIPLLNQVKIDTEAKINKAIEKGIIEGFNAMGGEISGDRMSGSDTQSNVIQDTIISYKNKNENIKLILFYKTSCSYCQEFLPTWYQIINNLPNNIIYEEIDADKDSESNKITNSNKITSVPTIMLLINKDKQIYMGNRTYKNIELFLKKNGINLVDKTFEAFDDSGYSTDPIPSKPTNKHCPAVTFDKEINLIQDQYMYQIFDEQGQYGYATGSKKDGSLLSPFTAAYSVVDSYLTSTPDIKHMNECASLYSKDIMGFGLCDNDSLNNVLTYQKQIKNGRANERVNGTNYSTNTNVVAAIKKACGITSNM